MKVLYIIATILALFSFHDATAQKRKLVDRRDQAEGWYVPIHGKVTAEGKKVRNVEVIIYRDNQELGRVKAKRNGKFELELDIDQTYTIRVMRDGYQEKLVHVDTSLPKDLVVYPDYECFINLMPTGQQNIDPFYTDFPSAIIRFDDQRGGFYHSDNYLAHIQTKLAGYANASP